MKIVAGVGRWELRLEPSFFNFYARWNENRFVALRTLKFFAFSFRRRVKWEASKREPQSWMEKQIFCQQWIAINVSFDICLLANLRDFLKTSTNFKLPKYLRTSCWLTWHWEQLLSLKVMHHFVISISSQMEKHSAFHSLFHVQSIETTRKHWKFPTGKTNK